MDHYTDELFELPHSVMVKFPYSRLLVDVERYRDSTDEPMEGVGMGAIYSKTTDGRELKHVGDRATLMNLYDKHHEALSVAVQRSLAIDGKCLIVDGHSFPEKPLSCDLDQGKERPDICIGTDPFHTPQDLVRRLRAHFEEHGLSVEVDRPYSGTMVPLDYYGRDQRVSSVMIEVNRRLYLKPRSSDKSDGYGRIRELITHINLTI